MTEKHLSETLVSSYASGMCSEAVALAVSAHLTYCADCRARVAEREALLGALMSAGAGVIPIHDNGPDDALLSRLDEEAEAEADTTRTLEAGPLPSAVAARVGMNFSDIPWKFRLPGVSEYEFLNDNGDVASLLRVKPGTAIPRHTHEAEELTVVLGGVLEDGDVSFHPGEIAKADASVDHNPRAGDGDVCICLAVLTGGVKFTGPLGRALNLFT